MIDADSSLTAYFAYMESIIRYGIIFLGNSVNIQKILIIKKKCIRNIFNLKKNESCKTTFKKQHILTPPCLYIMEAVMFVTLNQGPFENYINKHE